MRDNSYIYEGLFHRIIKVLRYMHRTLVMEEESERSLHQIQQSYPQLPTHDTLGHSQQDPLLIDSTHLYRAKQRFKTFIEEIGNLRFTPIRADITAYCGMQKKPQKSIENCIRPEALFKKIDTRIEKMIKNKRIKRNWGQDDLKILTWIVSKFSERKNYTDLQKDITHDDWMYIASLIPGVTAQACMFKWISIKKITLATHNWTKSQSQILSRIVRQRIDNNTKYQGEIKDWKEISQELYHLNQDEDKVYRNAKQCREHWTCYLSPHLKKGPWQLYQDLRLFKFIKDNDGLKKWSEIARHFEGRTENALKNRYTLIIDKQKKQVKNRNKTQLQLISQFLQKSYVDQFTVNVKTQADSINEENHSVKVQVAESTPLVTAQPKKEELCSDTNETTITPIRVQKFSLHDFQTMNIHFFKNIQPGIINPNGTFKKIANPGRIRELVIQMKKQERDEPKVEADPFSFTSIHKISSQSCLQLR